MSNLFISYSPANCPLHGINIAKISQDDGLKVSLSSEIIPIFSIKNYKPVNLSKIRALVNSFLYEIETKYDKLLLNVNPIELMHYFSKASAGLMIFDPNEVNVRLTASKSIFFKSSIGVYNVYLEVFFDETNGKYTESAVNVYKDKALHLASSSQSIQKILDELDEVLSFPGSYYSNIIEEQYELSGTPNTYSYI